MAFNAEAAVSERTVKEKMGTFMQTFERVAVKYAEYVEAKLALSARIEETPKAGKPGEPVFFEDPDELAKRYALEMWTLNQIAQTVKER